MRICFVRLNIISEKLNGKNGVGSKIVFKMLPHFLRKFFHLNSPNKPYPNVNKRTMKIDDWIDHNKSCTITADVSLNVLVSVGFLRILWHLKTSSNEWKSYTVKNHIQKFCWVPCKWRQAVSFLETQNFNPISTITSLTKQSSSLFPSFIMNSFIANPCCEKIIVESW